MKKTICLNMIVRDESDVILRCLESVLPLIDTWVIVDTGSKDNTPEIIERFFKEKGMPGQLYHRRWVNFATNRNQALRLAKKRGDYILFIDADEQLVYKKGFTFQPLDKDGYLIYCDNCTILCCRKLLVKASLDWKWVGVVHEMLESNEAKTEEILTSIQNFSSAGGGARSKNPHTLANDAKLLEKELKKKPNDSRTLFYLASTYLTMQKFDKALELFKKRAEIKQFPEEIFISYLTIAKLQETLKENPEIIFNSYLDAIRARPFRAESYFHLSRFLEKQKDRARAFEVAKKGMEFLETQDSLMVESKIYLFGMALQYSVTAAAMGEIEKAKEASLALLKKPNIPLNIRSFIERMWNMPA